MVRVFSNSIFHLSLPLCVLLPHKLRLDGARMMTMGGGASIPTVMKGVQMKNFGGPEVLQYRTDLPVPVPREGEVLVKNEFVGVNFVDVYVFCFFALFFSSSSSSAFDVS